MSTTTTPSPAAPERQPSESNSPAKQWSFTWNNYDDDSKTTIQSIYDESKATYIVYQEEIAPTTGTPHLQGFIALAKKQRRNQVRNLLPGCHLEKITRGTAERMIAYCKKDDSRKPNTEPVEMGDPPVAGKRNDLESFKTAVKEGTSWEDLMDSQSDVIARYMTFCRSYHTKFYPLPEPNRATFQHMNWHDTVNQFIETPNDRQVLCIIDPRGGLGKSRLADHLESTNPKVQILKPCKDADMAHVLNCEKSIFIIDCPRSRGKIDIPFNVIESIKDSRIMSGKYDSSVKLINKDNRVIIFTNTPPDPTKLSADRWKTYAACRDPQRTSWNLHECRPNETESWDLMTFPNPRLRLDVLTNPQVEAEREERERKRLRDEDDVHRRRHRQRAEDNFQNGPR